MIEEELELQVGTPSAQDLQVGSPIINNINNNGSGIPQLSIWGNERSPVHWRLLSSLDSGNANDTEWVEIAEDFRAAYHTQFLIHTSVGIGAAIGGIFFPPLFGVAAKRNIPSYPVETWS